MRVSSQLSLAGVVLGAACLFSAAPASAASFYCQAQVSDGGNSQLVQTISEHGCSRSAIMPGASAEANAGPGSLHLAARASANQNQRSGSAVTEGRDRFTVAGLGPNGALLQFSMEVSGLLLENHDEQSAGFSSFDARASMFTTLNSDSARLTGCYSNRAVQSVVSVCNGFFDVTDNQPVRALMFLDVYAFNGDVVNLNTRMDTSAYGYAPYTGASAQSLFLNSFEWMGLTRTPETANVVLTSESGFDYRYTSLPQGVPEPASWAIMIVGFGLAGGVLRRRAALGA